MSKEMNLQVGEYSLNLVVSREIIMESMVDNPEISESMIKGSNVSISKLYKYAEIALYYMAREKDKDFTKEKAHEVFEYASNCVVDLEQENGEQVETLAVDVLVSKIMEFVNMGFTKPDNAKKIKIALS